MTVVMYQGPHAEVEWRQDLAKYMSVWHPGIVQVYGAATFRNHTCFALSRCFSGGDVLNTSIRLTRWYWHFNSWLCQANSAFTRLGITSKFEDYVVLEGIEFVIRVCAPTGPCEGFLFLCPGNDTRAGPSTFSWPDCRAYWTLDPMGAELLSIEEANDFGVPSVTRSTRILGDHGTPACFDPDTLELTQQLGLPIYQLSTEIDARFAGIDDEDTHVEENYPVSVTTDSIMEDA
ncbi:hypothetical protein B0H13DRAFT_2313132 [Mycena leptocephala]|nr:hypothetical protein B0H13DRAFT_2313132 [Mycena leptocephala]